MIGISSLTGWHDRGAVVFRDLLFIEASKYPGHGALHITGNLGDVMRESCSIAVS